VQTVEQALDAPYDPALLSDYLLAQNAPEPPKKKRSGKRFSGFLTQKVLADATKLANATNTDLGIVFWAAWEIAKNEAVAKNDLGLTFEAGEAPVGFVSPRKPPPALGKNERSTSDVVTIVVPSRVDEEMRAFALRADVKYGRVLDYTYGLARERLWRGE